MHEIHMRLVTEAGALSATITRVEYTSALCEPFRLVIGLTLPTTSLGPAIFEGQELTFESDDQPYVGSIRGIVVRLEERLTERAHLEITIVPLMWLVGLRTNRRIFHDMTSVDIANEVLADHGPQVEPFESALVAPQDVRDYRVQTKESDLAFIERLFADDGLTHFYDHHTNRWVVTDDTTRFVPAAVAVPFIEAHGLGSADDVKGARVYAVSVTTSKVESGVAVRDYDFRRPTMTLEGKQGSGPWEVYVAGRGEFKSTEAGVGLASRVLQSLGARQKIFHLETNFLLAPGSTLRLDGAPREDANTTLLVVSAKTRFDAERVHADLWCIEAAKPWRPPLRSKPRIDGVDTAVVVGVPNQVINADKHGRILVQFHWDRAGRHSCRARVSQALAGAAFGTQFIPRVGMEVLVSYIDGDPEEPVVTGCVYNGENPPPFLLPANASLSGIRTTSIPDRDRVQEISFDDSANAEVLRIAAARNLVEIVPSEKSVSVGGDVHRTVGGDAASAIAGSSTQRVGRDASEVIDGSLSTNVAGDRTITVGHDRMTSVGGTDSMTIGKVDADGLAAWTVHGSLALSVAGDAGEILLSSSKVLRLKCGSSEIVLTPDEVRIVSKAITIDGQESVIVAGKGPTLSLTEDASVTAKKIELLSPKAWLCLEDEIRLVSQNIKLNASPLPNQPSESEQAVKPKTFNVQFLDQWNKPYDAIPYTLVVDGESFEGDTSEDGIVEQDIDPMAREGQITLWLDGTRNEGRTQRWHLAINELPDVQTPEGLRRSLTSLGYLRGGKSEREAIEAFQLNQGLPASGVADNVTRAKVKKVFGA